MSLSEQCFMKGNNKVVNEFFLRFNMHKCLDCFKDDAKFFTVFMDASEEDIQLKIDEIEAIHTQRSKMLKNKYADEINKIKGKKVLFLGDSISSDRTGYRKSVTKTAELNAFDGAVSGATSSGILFMARQLIFNQKPDMVSLLIGTNDVVAVEDGTCNQTSLSEYKRNISVIAKWAKENGSKLLLMEIPPINEEELTACFNGNGRSNSNAAVEEYNKALREIAQDDNVLLIPNTWTKQSERFLDGDGIHLNSKGHELLAEQWIINAAKLETKPED